MEVRVHSESISEWRLCSGLRFNSNHCHLVTMGPWPTHLACLNISFLTYKMGLFTLSCRTMGGGEIKGDIVFAGWLSHQELWRIASYVLMLMYVDVSI